MSDFLAVYYVTFSVRRPIFLNTFSSSDVKDEYFIFHDEPFQPKSCFNDVLTNV